ncbi:hypothetical protein HY734_02350 [Candidatus Uhrbacteria bacterium]|nr:hypothetical protein [Candidatus Uhrbacteria bacterium]
MGKAIRNRSMMFLPLAVCAATVLVVFLRGPEEIRVEREVQKLMQELLAHPPIGAVGYHVTAAMSTQLNDFVLVDEEAGRGGCAGRFQHGTRQQATWADAHIGTEVSSALLRVQVLWEIDADGCPSGQTVR